MRHRAIIAGFVVSLVAGATARGDTLIDTGPASTNTVGGTSLFNSAASSDSQFVAGQITLASATTIEGFSGWMTGSGNLDFNIYANTANNLPGAKLGGATGPVPANGVTPTWRDSPALSVLLPAGTYWVGFEAPVGFNATLPNGAASPLAKYAFLANGNANWGNLGTKSHGFRVFGTVAPEPTTLTAGVSGALLVLRRRRA